jgi:hypothetical protein
LNAHIVTATYAIASVYAAADTYDKSRKAYLAASELTTTERTFATIDTALETGLWQFLVRDAEYAL